MTSCDSFWITYSCIQCGHQLINRLRGWSGPSDRPFFIFSVKCIDGNVDGSTYIDTFLLPLAQGFTEAPCISCSHIKDFILTNLYFPHDLLHSGNRWKSDHYPETSFVDNFVLKGYTTLGDNPRTEQNKSSNGPTVWTANLQYVG
jgi:hypothetical protein